MYIYNFYNFDYDESVSFKLGHEKLFTKEYFEAIVNKVMDTIKIKKKEAKENLVRYCEGKLDVPDDKIDSLVDISSDYNYLKNVSKELINNYGFQDLKPEYTFVFNNGNYGENVKEVNKVIENKVS